MVSLSRSLGFLIHSKIILEHDVIGPLRFNDSLAINVLIPVFSNEIKQNASFYCVNSRLIDARQYSHRL